jgi:hypothetical protein
MLLAVHANSFIAGGPVYGEVAAELVSLSASAAEDGGGSASDSVSRISGLRWFSESENS